MSNPDSKFLDYWIEEDNDPKIKFNSLISVTVSTIMCIAAKCPVPKSNVETTKLFLKTITNDDGELPKNVKGFLSILENYKGPFDSNPTGEKRFEKSTNERPPSDKGKISVNTQGSKLSMCQVIATREGSHTSESQVPVRKTTRTSMRKTDIKKIDLTEKDIKKVGKIGGSRTSPSRSTITKI